MKVAQPSAGLSLAYFFLNNTLLTVNQSKNNILVIGFLWESKFYTKRFIRAMYPLIMKVSIPRCQLPKCGPRWSMVILKVQPVCGLYGLTTRVNQSPSGFKRNTTGEILD